MSKLVLTIIDVINFIDLVILLALTLPPAFFITILAQPFYLLGPKAKIK